MFAQEWHLIQPMLSVLVCHHFDVGIRGVSRVKWVVAGGLRPWLHVLFMPFDCCYCDAAINNFCAAASTAIFIVDAAADTLKTVGSSVTESIFVTMLGRKGDTVWAHPIAG